MKSLQLLLQGILLIPPMATMDYLAPVEDKIEVSEIGEQWSPNTEPAKVAPKAGINTAIPSAPTQIMDTIGIKIPNVSHAVPIEKERNDATKNTNTGKKPTEIFDVFTKPMSKAHINCMESSA